jgi:hypothetical protein
MFKNIYLKRGAPCEHEKDAKAMRLYTVYPTYSLYRTQRKNLKYLNVNMQSVTYYKSADNAFVVYRLMGQNFVG